MTAAVKVTDSMGDYWVYDGVSIYLTREGDFAVPVLSVLRGHRWVCPRFPTLDAAVDAIHTHLKGGGK